MDVLSFVCLNSGYSDMEMSVPSSLHVTINVLSSPPPPTTDIVAANSEHLNNNNKWRDGGIIILVLLVIALITFGIGWLQCAKTYNCYDPAYPIETKKNGGTEAETTMCYKNHILQQECVAATMEHCSNYHLWQWLFLGELIGIAVLIVLGCLGMCCYIRWYVKTSV